MRVIHSPVFAGVEAALQEILYRRWAADKVLQHHLKAGKKWGSQDRKLVAESVYDIVRWWRRLLETLGEAWPQDDDLEKVDARFIKKAIVLWCHENGIVLDRRVDVPALDLVQIEKNSKKVQERRASRESIPNWLDEHGFRELGDKWEGALKLLNQSAPVFLRANRLKTDVNQLERDLRQENLNVEWIEADALRLRERANLFLSKSFKNGLFEVQDLNSQKVAPFLKVEPGMRVIDACAGAGGKSLHLAALMKNKGKIIALDVNDKRLEQLHLRVKRAGVSCLEVRKIESQKVIKRLEASADRLLLDVPCTGLGVLRRNPDSKWKMQAQQFKELNSLQREILEKYSRMLKVDGFMVYSTCSILPSENEDQIRWFMSQFGAAWVLEEERSYLPTAEGADGFYMARLRKRS